LPAARFSAPVPVPVPVLNRARGYLALLTAARALLATVALALVAVAAPPASAQQTITLPPRDRPLEMPVRALYTVGVIDGAEHEMFGRVSAVAFDDAGHLFVLDRDNHRVLVYGPDGGFVRMFGRRGGGPGELQAPMAMAVTGNEVMVVDMAHSAVVVYSRDGTHLHNVPFDEDRPGRAFAAHPKGGFLYEPMAMSVRTVDGGMPQVTRRETLPILWRRGDASAAPRTVFEAPAPAPGRQQVNPQAGGMVVVRSGAPATFSPALQWGVLPDGGLAVARSERYRLEVTGDDGRVARVIERAIAPRRVTERDKEHARALRERAVASGAGVFSVGASGGAAPPPAQIQALAQQSLASMTFAEIMPVIQAVAVDGEGRIWVRRAGDREYDRGPIDIMAADGRYMGTLPAGTRTPSAFGPGGLVAYVETDDMDIQRVRVGRM
jgi:hypothetical protein